MGWGFVPSYKKERDSFASGVSSIWNNINSIWDQLNVEIKNHDVVHTPTSAGLSTTPTFYGLTDIGIGITGGDPTGVDTGYRDGDKIRLKTCNVKVNLKNSSTTETIKVRCFIVKHYENFDGVGVLYDNIYDNTTNGYLAPASMINLRNNEHSAQYKILASRQVRLSPSGVDMNNEKTLNLFVKFNRKVGSYVEFDGGLPAGHPSNGKLYFCIFCDNAIADAVDIVSRVTYIDN